MTAITIKHQCPNYHRSILREYIAERIELFYEIEANYANFHRIKWVELMEATLGISRENPISDLIAMYEGEFQ